MHTESPRNMQHNSKQVSQYSIRKKIHKAIPISND